jgi:nucleobase transporter 1/2
MAVGGIIALILDNLVPGTPEERGLVQWQGIKSKKKHDIAAKDLEVYDLPFGIGSSWKISKFLPFMPYRPANTEPEKDEIQLRGFREKTDEENNS